MSKMIKGQFFNRSSYVIHHHSQIEQQQILHISHV